MIQSRVQQLACLALLAVLAGCTQSDGSSTTAAVASTTTTVEPPSTSTSSTVTVPSSTTTTLAPSATDIALVDAFIEFAKSPADGTFADLSTADLVTLGLGTQTLRPVGADELRQPEAWVFGVEVFRAYTGPFSALTLLESLGDHLVQVGEHPHCAGPPQPAPLGFENHKRLSVQPTGIDSCLNWFTVDFFVGPDDEVEAVTLDLWEP